MYEKQENIFLVVRLRQKETELKQRSDGLENLLRRTEMKIQMPLNVFLMGQPGEEEKERAACVGFFRTQEPWLSSDAGSGGSVGVYLRFIGCGSGSVAVEGWDRCS